MSRARRFTVAEVVAETADALSVGFDVPAQDTAWFRHRPGQFVTVRVPIGDGVPRCYSLSSGPGERPTITVKRAGPASAWICDRLRAGDELQLLPPAGRFTPTSPDADLLLIAAGSGITPVMSILRWVLAAGSAHVGLLYANRDAESVIFARQLRLLQVRHPGRLTTVHWLESERGRPAAAGLADLLADRLTGHCVRETFLCGPEPFMAEVAGALEQGPKPRGRLHIERYESLRDDPFALAEAADETPPAAEAEGEPAPGQSVVEVEFDGDKHRVAWAPDRPLLEVLERAGIQAPFSCREGNCGACACLMLEGRVAMRRNEALTREDLDEGYILACQATPSTPVVRVTYD